MEQLENRALLTVAGNGLGAAADFYSLDEDTTLSVSAPGVLGNDAGTSAVLVAGPANGAVSFTSDGSFSYTPLADWFGTDSFTYQALDGELISDEITVTLTVNDVPEPPPPAPVAGDDTYTTDEDTPLTIGGAGVLDNDQGQSITAAVTSGPANGSVTMNSDGSFTYTPNADFHGSDSFAYTVTDSANQTDDAQVTITVNAVNDPPVASELGFSAYEDQQLMVYSSPGNGLLYGASDPDNDGNLTPQLVSQASHGYVDFSYYGSFIYTPAAEFSGTDSFTYQISDGNGGYSNVATVTIQVDPVNDAPVAVDDYFTLAEDDYTFSGNLLANDSDIDSPTFSPTLATGVSNGNLIVQMDGSFVYNPYANFFGTDSFTYYVSDGLAQSNTVTVWLTITEVNDAPIGAPDSYSTNEDSGFWMSGSSGVLGNDYDVETYYLSLTPTLITAPTNGTFWLGSDGGFSYTPYQDFFGEDTFTYQASDGQLFSEITTVTITVYPINDTPVAADQSYTLDEDTPLTITDLTLGLLAGASDVDGDTLSVAIYNSPQFGQITWYDSSTGAFSYVPNENYFGNDYFTYLISDGNASAFATANLTINSVNDAPSFMASEPPPVNEDAGAQSFSGWATFDPGVSNESAQTATYTVSNVSNLGMFAVAPFVAADGTLSYTPAPLSFGTSTFDVIVQDNGGTANGGVDTSSTQVFTIEVTPIIVDIDTDSNNRDGITEADDPIEDQAPGRLVVLNNDDDNGNGTPDRADPEDTAGENDLVALVTRNLGTENWSAGTTEVQYNESVIKLYYGPTRSAPIASGSHLSPNTTIYAEGLNLGSTLVTWTYTVGGLSRSDAVRLTVFEIDIDTDSNNDGVIDPSNSLATGTDDPIENQDPGRIVFLNDDEGAVAGENDLAQLLIRDLGFEEWTVGTLTVEYDESKIQLYHFANRNAPIASGDHLSPAKAIYAEGVGMGSTLVTCTYTVGSMSTSDTVALTVIKVDIDTDSNHDGIIDPIDAVGIGTDDPIEEATPGRLVRRNGDDDNGNGVADYLEPEGTEGENDLVAIVTRDLGTQNWTTGTAIINYFGSVVRLYHGPDRSAPIESGSHVSPDTAIYAEGVGLGSTLVIWTYSVGGTGRSDAVRLTVFDVDIDADSNNDGTIDPNNNIATGTDDPIEEHDPGRIVFVNDDDDDANLSPDLWDLGSIPGENDLVLLSVRGLGFQEWTVGSLTVNYDPLKIRLYHSETGDVVIYNGEQISPSTEIYAEGQDSGSTLVTLNYSVGSQSFSDVVRLKVYSREIDLNIDSDNNNGYAHPERSSWEEFLEDNLYGLGKLVMLDNPSRPVTPIVISLPKNLPSDTQLIGVKLGWNPLGLAGEIRLWARAVIDENRNQAALNAGGDRIFPHTLYSLNDLRYDPGTGRIVVFAEGIAENAAIKTLAGVDLSGKPDERVKATLVIDGNTAASDEVKYLVANEDSFFYHLQTRQEVRNELASRGVYTRADMPQFSLQLQTAWAMEDLGILNETVELLGEQNGIGGFIATFYQDYITGQGEYVLAFAGTDPTELADWAANLQQGSALIPGISYQYAAAMDIAAALSARPNLQGRVIITGHSLGGGLASAAVVASGMPGQTFNAAGLHPWTVDDEQYPGATANYDNAAELIDAYYVNHDVLSFLQDNTFILMPSASGRRILLVGPYLFSDPIQRVLSHLHPAILYGLLNADDVYE